MIVKYLFSISLLGILGVLQAQMPKASTGKFALTHATIETVTQGKIQNGSVLISNGNIEEVGVDITIPSDYENINCTGLMIYPGMIDGGTRLGLSEIGSDPRTRDYNEVGDVIPFVQALTAVNPNSVLIPVARVNGITTVLTVPSGGLFPGTAALIHLHGYTPKQMYAGFKGVVCNFPLTGRRNRWDNRTDEEIKKKSKEAMRKLNEIWNMAVQFQKIDSASAGKNQPYYPEIKGLLPVVRREQKLLINVNTAKDIRAALKWVEKNNIDAILMGVAEGWRVAKEIGKAQIPVITGPVLSNTTRQYDPYDKPYANAGAMLKVGVQVAIRTNETENVRNLPYHAGFSATYGMGKEEALKAVTIIPAQIFGLNNQLGSIEKGKVANLFVTDGDIFETKTQVKHVFIEGWSMPMESRHTQLYDEFLKRAPGISKE